MPHRVTSFFRKNSTENPSDLKTKPRHPLADRTHYSPTSPAALDDEANPRKMPDAHKRLSFQGLTHSAKSSSKSLPHQPASLDVVIESPPLVFYGPAEYSTGALLSGQLVFQVHDDALPLESFSMKLSVETTRKRPFHAHCQDCTHQTTDLTTWNFLQAPVTLPKGKPGPTSEARSLLTNPPGEHSFPFSFLLPGNLPITMKGGLSTIEYVLRATVCPTTGEPMKLSRLLNVKRAIYPSETPRHSIRIFPPTNITATCTLPAVIHPIGEVNVHMRMDGMLKRNPETKTAMQWKLKRLTWRLDETQKAISPACAKHAVKAVGQEGAKKGISHQDVRMLAMDELKTGWKSDYSGPDGTIEIEFPLAIQSNNPPICSMKSADGTTVSHILVVEMIVAEEFVPGKKPSQAAPTGAARVLRMHFNLTVTERAGLGISWDEEQPPLYENVPASPPAYITAHVYEGEPIPDYDELTPLDLSAGGSSGRPSTEIGT